MRVISAGDAIAHENKALIDWLRLHGINPDDCFRIEEGGRQIRFHCFKRNPLSGYKFKVLTERGLEPATRIVTVDAKVTLAEAGI